MNLVDAKIMGEKLREYRGARTGQEVADALGISRSALGNYEAGQRIPRDSIKVKIAKYYKKSIEDLFFSQP